MLENESPSSAKATEGLKKSEVALREEEILKFWQEHDIFKKTLGMPATKGDFIFYEGPPTANGRPGIHHLESRAFKDAVLRYRTMQGYRLTRKSGWDTHGLPVELEVEKEIGSKSKKDIEAFGIAAFNKKCKESVLRYIDEWKNFSDRIAFWNRDAYFTFENNYIESVWNILKTAHEKKLVYKDYKVVPWCPRCGTALSSHEVAQGYEETKDPAVYVKFKIVGASEYILAWTTTPWTLPGNVALAVGADIDYVKVRAEHSVLWVAKQRLAAIAPEAEVLDEKKGSELVGLEYEPLYPFLKNSAPASQHDAFEKAYQVYEADFVSTEDGTGIVHTAIMYGADDFELGTKIGLPKHHLVSEDGTFSHNTGQFAGKFVKTADQDIIDDLEKRGLLYKKEVVEHTYPFCWRCKTPLLYYARDSWYIRMSSLKGELVSENKKIHWEPEHIRDGRFGEWLKDVKDWAISRSRYWGTPLPFWECDTCKEFTVVGSIAELKERAKAVPGSLDLHRPYVDEIVFDCETCGLTGQGGKMRRVPEVLDVWFDSGAMPFAQYHYPFEKGDLPYPADYIVEAIDQTRGWFYTLHAVGAIMGRGRAFKNVICLGHVLDAKGKKMSKSVGNIVVPSVAIDKYGVDALRYFMYTVNSPGESKNFDERLVDEIVKKNLGRLNNVLAFYQLYASGVGRSSDSKHVLDRWILARLSEFVRTATDGFENYQLDAAMRPLSLFIDDLSVWYVRRSRDRFKEAGADKTAALATLRHVLYSLALLMAPGMPFFAEHLFQAVRGKDDAESVHMATWPEAKGQNFFARLFGASDAALLASMREAREVVTQALEARQKENIKVRQPLQSLTVTAKLSPELQEIVRDEVNVKEIRVGSAFTLDTVITPELKEEGDVRDFIRSIQQFRKEQNLKPGQRADFDVPAESHVLAQKYRAQIEKITTTTLKLN